MTMPSHGDGTGAVVQVGGGGSDDALVKAVIGAADDGDDLELLSLDFELLPASALMVVFWVMSLVQQVRNLQVIGVIGGTGACGCCPGSHGGHGGGLDGRNGGGSPGPDGAAAGAPVAPTSPVRYGLPSTPVRRGSVLSADTRYLQAQGATQLVTEL